MGTAAASAGAAGPSRAAQACGVDARSSPSASTAGALGKRLTVSVSQTHCRPRPELDIDLIPAHLSPGDSEAGARPVGGRLRADEGCAVGSYSLRFFLD